MQKFRATTASGAVYTITITQERKLPMAKKAGRTVPLKVLCIRRNLLPNLRASVKFKEESAPGGDTYLSCYNAAGGRTMRVLPKKLFKGGILADPHGNSSTEIVDLVKII